MRAAASALLVALAVGAGGAAGMTSALAVESPAMTHLSGTLTTPDGAPLAAIDLVVEALEETEGGLAGYPITTDASGQFAVDIEAWGTTESPARLTVRTAPDQELTIDGDDCSQTFGVTASFEGPMTAADGTALEPVALVATLALIGEACDLEATPPPAAPGNASKAPDGGVLGAKGTPGLTPPPTDISAGVPASDPDGGFVTVGLIVGLVAATLLAGPARRTPRRDS